MSRRLRQLVGQGLLERTDEAWVVSYSLTSKGEDAVYLLLALLRFGIRHNMRKGAGYHLEDAMSDLHYQTPFGPPPKR